MDTRRYGEVSVLHIEPATYAKLLHLAGSGPGRPRGLGYDPEDPWHQLIVEPHSYGCWVHTGIAEDGETEGLPPSLLAILREALARDASWVLFDADLQPMLDVPVFEHPDGPRRPNEPKPAPPPPKRIVFSYPVPVCVVVEDGLVRDVVVVDETAVAGCALVEGDPGDLDAAVAAATDGQDWPSWRFGW